LLYRLQIELVIRVLLAVLVVHGRADDRALVRVQDEPVAFEGRFRLRFGKVSKGHVAARMGKAGYASQHHERLELLGELEGPLDHVLGFLEVAGLEQGNLHEPREVPRLPFVDA